MAIDYSKYGATKIEEQAPTEAVDYSKYGATPYTPSEEEKAANTAEMKQQVLDNIKPIQETGDPQTAFAANLLRGPANFALDIGNLAGDILSSFGTTKSAGESLNKLVQRGRQANVPSTDLELSNPRASALGDAIGYGVSSIAMPGGIVRATGAALKSIIPGLSGASEAAPVISSMIRESASGALGGGAMSASGERGYGAAIGGGIGGVAGLAGGLLGRSLTAGNEQIAPAVKLTSSQGSELTPEAIAAARNELATGQLAGLRQQIGEDITGKIQQQMTPLIPKSASDLAPNQTLLNSVRSNYAEVSKTSKDLYAPFNKLDTNIDVAPLLSKYKELPNSVKAFIPEASIKPVAQGQAANIPFNRIKDYKQDLDLNAASAKRGLTGKDYSAWSQFRSEVAGALDNAAEALGKGPQWRAANDFYAENITPFKTLNKSGQLKTPAQTDAAWKSINTIIGGEKPDPTKLRGLVKSLGPEGKEQVGWAYLQNAITKSLDIDGIIDPSTLSTKLNAYKGTGLDDIFATPQYKQATYGIQRLVKEGSDRLSNVGTQAPEMPVIGNIINYLTQSKLGIMALIKLGKMDPKSKAFRDAAQQILTGGSNLLIQRPDQRPEVPNE